MVRNTKLLFSYDLIIYVNGCVIRMWKITNHKFNKDDVTTCDVTKRFECFWHQIKQEIAPFQTIVLMFRKIKQLHLYNPIKDISK